MKLKVTPTRVSLLALGAFAAVVAQELTRSDAKTPSATPNSSKSKRTAAASPSTTPALSQPESLFSSSTPPLIPGAQLTPTTPKIAIADPKPTASTSRKAPPKPATTQPRLKITEMNQFPIDDLIEQTLNLATTAPPPPPPKMVARAAEDDKPAPVQTADSTPKDIQGHRAQASITALMEQGIMQGYSDGTFRPNAKMTDEQFQSVLNKVSSRSKSLATLRRPRDIVTRADAATYIYRQLQRTNAIETPEVRVASANPSAPLPKLAAAPVTEVAQSRPLPPATVPVTNFETNPVADAADADSYTLGAGDRVRVEVFNVPEYSKDYTVLVNGTLSLHRAGSLSVAGLTMRQAQSAIAAKYARLVKDPIVDLSLTAARPLNVAIAGEVGKPGTYALTFGENGKFPTVTKLIREAGGMNRSADARQVVVRRPQRGAADQQIKLDLWELFSTGNLRQDLTLRDGDSIFIPAANSINLAEANQMRDANFSVATNQPIEVAIVGEVLRPGPYTMKDQTPTLSAAIRQAGGIKQLANLKEVKVTRNTRAGQAQTINVDLWQLLKSGDLNQDLVLQQGDTVSIPTAVALNPEQIKAASEVSFAGNARVTVVGEVVRPGQIEVPSSTSLNQALLLAGGFTRQANRRRVELVRLNDNGSITRREVSIDLARGIDENGNPLLRNGDVLVVDRSGTAKAGDAIESVLRPVFQVLPFRSLFGL